MTILTILKIIKNFILKINIEKAIVIIAFFCILYFWQITCNRPVPEIITEIDTVTVTVMSDFLIYDTIKYSDVKIINDTIYLNNTIIQKDTVFIYVEDYLAKKFYCDTVLNDTAGLIIISDTIHKNSIYTRRSDIMLYNTTKIIQDNDKHFFIGAGTAFSFETNTTFNANFYYQNKKNTYGVGVNTEKQILFNYIYKLR